MHLRFHFEWALHVSAWLHQLDGKRDDPRRGPPRGEEWTRS
jgi:hypothetical protein